MKLLLTRKTYTTRSTIGELTVDGKFQCYVLEDPVRPAKIKGCTAIPAGSYRVTVSWSARFKQRMPLLEDVPGFEGIRIHKGNTPDDTEGCLLVGKVEARDSIGTSREAYDALMAILEIEIAAERAVSMEIVEGGVSPFMKAVAAPLPEMGAMFIVQADPLRLRSAPDAVDAGNIVGRLPFGLAVSATGEAAPAGWMEVAGDIEGEAFRGFVSASSLEAVPKAIVVEEGENPEPTEPLFRVATCGLHLRAEPAVLTDESIVASLEKDQLVSKLAETAQPMWWQVAAVVHGETLQGFLNASYLSPDDPVAPVNSDCPAPPSTGELAISEKALQLILDFEGMDQPSIWPGQGSGISLGHGYDLGYHTHDDLMGDWGKYLPDGHLVRLCKCIGKRGAGAKALAPSYSDIRVTSAAATAVFMNCTVPKIRLWALKTFPGILALPVDAQGALTSLVYNRGTDLTGDRRREMRDIRDTVADAALSMRTKLDRIAALFRAMKRIWPNAAASSGHPGIRRRREAEAALVESCGPAAPARTKSRDFAAPKVPEETGPALIAEFLDRDYVLRELVRQRASLAEIQKRALSGDKPVLAEMRKNKVTKPQLARAIAALDDALAKAKLDLEHAQGDPYIPPDPIACTVQNGLTEIAIEAGKVWDNAAEPSPLTGRMRGFIGEKSAADTSPTLRLRRTREPFIEGDPFHHGDPLYALDGFMTKFGALFSKRHKFNKQPAKVAATSKSLSLFLFGDWGTGLPLAREVTKRISEQLAATDGKRQQHVIHLGDVYYGGEAKEYETRAIPFWPQAARAGKAIGSWNLNANHDMYSGGNGYFETMLRQDFMLRWHGDKDGNPSSFFLIEDKDWQIFGLDTAWNLPSLGSTVFGAPTKEDYAGQNGRLTPEQAKWMARVRDPAKGCILLTHHQPASSRNSETGVHSDQAVEMLKDAGVYAQIDAWIWGHEHRCVVFKPKADRVVAKLKDAPHFCACLGSAGIPVTARNFAGADKNADVLWQEDRFDVATYENLPVLPFGFGRIDTAPGKFEFRIFDHTGKQRYASTVNRPQP